MATEENGHNESAAPGELDVPTINGAPAAGGKKRRPGLFGLGSGGQAGATVAQSGFRGIVGGKLLFGLKLMPMFSTVVMGVMVPAMNHATNKAEYERARASALALKSDVPLPSDEAVDKMRQNTNLDNEALVRSKHAGSGMKFGDEEYADPAAGAGDEASAKAETAESAAPNPAATEAAKAAEAAQAQATGQGKFGESKFGQSAFGNAAGGGFGGGSGGGGGGFGTGITNYAPEAKFGAGIKNKATKGTVNKADAQAKALAKGSDSRRAGGRLGKSRGQLRAAAAFSRNASRMKQYQASAATAGRAFDGGTQTADTASGIGGAGQGEGGAGAGEGEQAGMDSPDAIEATVNTPKVEKPKGVPNESCKEENLKDMKPPNGPMNDTDYGKLEGKCKAQEKMNIAYLAMAALALLTIPLAIEGASAKTMIATGTAMMTAAAPGMPYTSALMAKGVAEQGAGYALQAKCIAAGIAIMVAAIAFAAWAISAAKEFPSLKGQSIGLGVGATLTSVSAGVAMMGGFSGTGTIVMTQMTQASSSAMQGLQGAQ